MIQTLLRNSPAIFFLFFCFLFVPGNGIKAQQRVNIIPQPVEVKIADGSPAFLLDRESRLVLSADSKLENHVSYLNDYLDKYYGIRLKLAAPSNFPGNQILLTIGSNSEKSEKDSYQLKITEKKIDLSASTPEGLFYGIQTLLQLLPVDNHKSGSYSIPQVSINDHSRFSYRGMHLDVSRHYFPVSFLKRYIDYLAFHKLNTFHWHLTDDQGWRIEIKKYPRLQTVGAWRNGSIIGRYPGKGNDNIYYGGYYTKNEIKEVVNYAKARYINVIPEIEMPGHASAAIAAYPELSCFPQKPTVIPANMISVKSKEEQSKGRIKLVQETWGIFDDVFCAGKENTFRFLENVIDEVLELFPSKFIHVGGDECPKTHWKKCPDCQKRMKENNLKDEHELQSYFIQRMEKYLNKKGRTLIGWDEILEGGLAPNAVVMSWRGEKGGIQAAKEKHNVIMTPGNPLYFDHTQSSNEDSVTIGGYNPIDKVYDYEPQPKELNEQQAQYILGAQANLWTEYIDNTKKVEYMLFPRLEALSEILWTAKERKNWQDFQDRLPSAFKRYEQWNSNYSSAYYKLKASVLPTEDFDGILWKLETRNNKNKIAFSKKLTMDDPPNPPPFFEYSVPIPIKNNAEYSAWTLVKGGMQNAITQKFNFNAATGKQISLKELPSKNYPGDGAFTLVNGVVNEKALTRSREFLGFLGTDCEAIIDLGKEIAVTYVIVHALRQEPSWIYQPQKAEAFGSNDGKSWRILKSTSDFNETNNGKGTMIMTFNAEEIRYIKIVLTNYGIIPDDQPGAGSKAWLFVDEIEVGGRED